MSVVQAHEQGSKRKPIAFAFPQNACYATPSPDGKWLAAWAPEGNLPHFRLYVCTTSGGRWRIVTMGDGRGTWSSDSHKYEYDCGYLTGYPELGGVAVPSYRMIKFKLPYSMVTSGAYSPKTDEIAVLTPPTHIAKSQIISQGHFAMAAVLAPRYSRSGCGSNKYLAYYPKMENSSMGFVDEPTMIRWSSSGKYFAFIDAYSNGEGPVYLINVPHDRVTLFDNFRPLPEDAWVLNNGWVISSYGAAGSASGSHRQLIGLPPLRDDGYDHVANVYQAGPHRFLLAVFRQFVGPHPILEIWEGQDSPKPNLTRRLLTVPTADTSDVPGTSPITFTQHGEAVWIPVGNNICQYYLGPQ